VVVLYTGMLDCSGTLDDMGGVVVIILVYFVGVARVEKYGWRGAEGRFRLYMRLFVVVFMSCDVTGVVDNICGFMMRLYTYNTYYFIGVLPYFLISLLPCS